MPALKPNQVHLGDCLEVLKTLPDSSVDSIVTDPPYGLSSREPTAEDIIRYLGGAPSLGPLKKGVQHCANSILRSSVVPQADDLEPQFAQDLVSFKVSVHQPPIMSSGVIQFDDQTPVGSSGEKEVNRIGPVGKFDNLLVDNVDSLGFEALKDRQFCLRESQTFTGCVEVCGCFTSVGPALFRMVVRLVHNPFGEPEGAPFIVTDRATEVCAVLTLDVARVSGELVFADPADQADARLLLTSSECIGTASGAGSLTTLLKRFLTCKVGLPAGGAITLNVAVPRVLLDRFHSPHKTHKDFMGHTWEIPPVAVWRECYRALKPGGHLLSFGSTRTFDLISMGLRFAGFECRDTVAAQFSVQVFQWVYGCLSEDSEILTEHGWVGPDQLKEGLSVATWDPATEGIGLRPVLEVFRAPYQGSMVCFRNDNTDQLLTPNHRVFKRHAIRRQVAKTRRKWFEEEWVPMEAAEINRWQAIKLPLAGYHDGAGIGGEDYAAFLAWIWTEGGFDNSWTGVRIYQSSVNPDHVVEIDRLTQKFAPDFKKYERVRTYKGREYTEYTWFFSGEPALSVREILPGKHPTYDLLWRMTLDEKRAFLSAAMDGDGSVGQKQFYQKDGVDREWFQVLAHMIGWQGRDNAKKRCVSLHDNRTTELQSRHLHATHLKDYDGEVWCVRVETGAFVARRNGRVFITGNSGFPKSLNVKKAVLKAGVDSEAASQFDGLGTALKPSWEPILVFRKPLSEATVAQNVLKHGTGGLNIDATRIGHTTRTNSSSPGKARNTMVKGMVGGVETEVHNHGRWPANTLMIHSTECEVVGSKRVKAPVINRFDDGMKPFGDGAGHSYTSEPQGDADGMEEIPVYECVEGCPVKALDKQSGFRAPGWFSGECQKGMGYHGAVTTADGSKPSSVVGEGGGASRYFGQFEPEAPFFYTAKVSKQEREGWMKGAKNPHPTMKSLSLMEWLVKLVTPRGGTTLDPYCGTGTTCVAAIQAGCQYVGIEKDPDFHALAEARLKALRTKSGDKAFDDDLADISSRLEELVPEE